MKSKGGKSARSGVSDAGKSAKKGGGKSQKYDRLAT